MDIKLLVFNLANEKFAFRLDNVKEIVRLPQVTLIPNSPKHLRGFINLRSNVIQLVDLRVKMNYPTQKDEIDDLFLLLREREQDHINWLNELILSVDEKREFKLTTDPRMCRFGQWYYNFKTDNIVLSNLLTEFEIPHNQIHNLAKEVKDAISQNDYELAHNICFVEGKHLLDIMIDLFKRLYENLSETIREFAIIFNEESKVFAVTADQIDRIITTDSSFIEPVSELTLGNNGLVNKIYKKDNDLFKIIDDSKLFLK